MSQLPISRFLTQRLIEYDETFELRQGTGFVKLFFKPLQFIVQPIRDEFETIRIGQSFRLIKQQDDPDAFDKELVSGLAENIFVFRREVGYSSGSARVSYQNAVEREYPTGGFTVVAGNSKVYTNPAPFKITATEMSAQVEEGMYYMDVPVVATEPGADGDIEIDELVEVIGDDEVIRVTNPVEFSDGIDEETNIELMDRSRNSIGVRDLVVPKGFRGILFENFKNSLLEAQPIGFRDPEMIRDIIYNTHIGGRTDGYVKTTKVTAGSKLFTGLLLDTTRQAGTMTNATLVGTDYASLGNPSIDPSNGLVPIVKEIKASIAAFYDSPVDMSGTIDLSTNQYIKLTVDGTAKNIRVAGVVPGTTSRAEILSLINSSFGIDVAFINGVSISVRSPTSGLTSEVVIDNPDSGTSAIQEVFDLAPGGAPFTYSGDGPVTFEEGVHYDIEYADGEIRRIEGAVVLAVQNTGETTLDSALFDDATGNIFLNVQVRDVVRILSGADQGDYRVLEKVSSNQLSLDAELTDTASNIQYQIFRSGIKSGEIIQIRYWFNPLSIDIGKYIPLSTEGDEQNPVVLERGIRPGRDSETITDLPLLRVTSIEVVDALTGEGTGEILDHTGGYGQGGYGRGGYGVGEGQDWYLVVNTPETRFSMFENSYIVIRSGYQGSSFRVNYEYAPEIENYHNFVLSATERVLDGDTLMKHMVPCYVKGEILYSVDSTDTSIPTNDSLQASVRSFISKVNSAKNLDYSDINQFITRTVDPHDGFGTTIKTYKLIAEIHNMDGTINFVTGDDFLEFLTRDPLGTRIGNPLSPRICHWIADETEFILTRETDEA